MEILKIKPSLGQQPGKRNSTWIFITKKNLELWLILEIYQESMKQVI